MNIRRIGVLALSTLAVTLSSGVLPAPTASYKAIPPFLAINTPKPNVLIVLDNSNSMDEYGKDEAMSGEAVGSSDPTSRSEIARHALKDTIIPVFKNDMRFGLMAYRQSNVHLWNIHNSYYYASYDPTTLHTPVPDPDPNFTPRDRVDTDPLTVVHTNTRQVEIQPGRVLYYDRALPFYSSGNEGIRHCYSTRFTPRKDPSPPVTNINVNIAQDNSYRCCTAKTGALDISPDGVDNDAAAKAEFSGTCSNFSFNLTDSDVAEGFWQIGSQHAWSYRARACESTSTPGGGFLHVPVGDSTAAQITALEGKLGTWTSAAGCGNDTTPISNAGFTPIASTLGSAHDYFRGALPAAHSATRSTPSTPVQYSCQRTFVVLVTDGLPTEDPNGNGDFIDDATLAAEALRTTSIPGYTEPCDIQTFVLGFALPKGAVGALDPIADKGGTGKAYYAGSEAELGTTLTSIFQEILNRSSSGTATALNLGSFRGEGMAVRATFQPKMTDGTRSVTWVGHVNALFIDAAGDLREDDGDEKLEDAASDPYIDMCYDPVMRVTRVKKSSSLAARPNETQTLACSSSIFDSLLSDIKNLWDGGHWLAAIPDANIPTQRVYNNTGAGRYILTGLDASGVAGDGLVTSAEQQQFVAATFTDKNAGLLGAANALAAEPIVNYIRGLDQAGQRSRQIDLNGTVRTWRLGDVVYSSPAVAGRPAENFDLIYRDPTYKAFFDKYRKRRQMVYVGANDGMLHAFNAGYFDADNKEFLKGASGHTQYDLGAELWAYVPYNTLPHLPYLAGSSYGTDSGDHVYYVDLRPRVFDARVFTADATHPGGWGTVLVGGMRLGGGEIDADADLTSADPADIRTLRSSYFLLDVTNPEEPPRLLLEFTHPELGYTLSVPAPVTVCGTRAPDGSCSGDSWYLMLGSGPHPANATALHQASSDQKGRLFLLDLKTLKLVDSFGSGGIKELDAEKSMVSDLIAVDYNLDYSADAVYFGTIEGVPGDWKGDLQRVRIVNDDTPGATWTYKNASGWAPSVLYDTGRPITAMPSIALDAAENRWLFVGTGRYLVQPDALDTSAQRYYGIKEPRNTSGGFTWGTVPTGTLLNVTGAEVFENSEGVTGLIGTSITGGSPCAIAGADGKLDYFSEVECYLRQFSHAADHKSGWYRDFASKERSIGQAAVLAGALTYTGFTPSTVMCEGEGTSRLNALYFGTGTAYRKPIIGLKALTSGSNHAMETVKALGIGAAVTPSLHTGAGYTDGQTKAFIQTSTGTTLAITEDNPLTVRPGEISWREHKD